MNALAKVRETALTRRKPYDDEDDKSLVAQAIHTAFTPLRIAISRPAIKVYLTTFLFFFTSFVLVSISTTAYLVFYYNFIPQIGLSQVVYLQYDANAHPHATIPIDTSALISQQPYDVYVSLLIPRTPSNLAAGNFMLDLSLYPDSSLPPSPLSYILNTTANVAGSKPLARSRRPAILPYNSYVTSLSHKLLHLPIHLLSLKDLDATDLKVPLFERLTFSRGRTNIPATAYLEIQSQTPPKGCPPTSQPVIGLHLLPQSTHVSATTIQIYSAQLHFHARFEGLRFYVYNYRTLSFLVFSSLFYGFAITSMAVAWAFITAVLSARNSKSTLPKSRKLIKSEDSADSSSLYPKVEAEDDQGRPIADIKAEPDSDEDSQLDSQALAGLSSTERTFPALGRNAQPLRYTPSSTTEPSEDARSSLGVQREDATHDAEDEGGDDEEEARGRIITPISGIMQDVKDESDDDDDRFRADSGIGTSMESDNRSSASGVRRRSSRGGSQGRGSSR